MDPLVLEILASLARAALSLLSGYLVAHHVITADLGDRLTTHVVEHVAIWGRVSLRLSVIRSSHDTDTNSRRMLVL